MTKPVLSLITALLVVAFGTVGCASSSNSEISSTKQDNDLVTESYQAADFLIDQVPWLREQRGPVLVATFVDVNALESSSALGRIVAEQVASRFAQEGFTVIDMKLRDNIFIQQNGGEFMLSRDVRALSQTHNASAILAGTYAVGRRSVYVSARLIRASDSLILSGYDYSLPMGPDTRALLASQ
ncbi:MAG: FlgO family outer membrane protein [Candidatus Competibacteraceae bacterium]|jgi:TolB-like protein|nr:FlgO family outer membrane protein [Candidatus Competibacteraceae bacterium]